MVKKITPDPPPCSDESVKPIRPDAARLLDTLALTLSKTVNRTDPLRPTIFAIQAGVTAHDALSYVSKLLEVAELNGDEISLHTNPVCSGQQFPDTELNFSSATAGGTKPLC